MLKNLSNLSILIAEDDDDLRGNLVEYFKWIAKEVLSAKNGFELIQIADANKPDIILFDINMPDLSGLDAIAYIREKDKITRAIAISAYSDTEILLKAVKLNLSGYIVKPIRTKELENLLTEAMEQIERIKNSSPNGTQALELGNCYTWDKNENQLLFLGDEVVLTRKEKSFFNLLASKKGYLCTFDEIILVVWGVDSYEKPQNYVNNIKVMVRNLRAKLRKDIIVSRYGEGYMLS